MIRNLTKRTVLSYRTFQAVSFCDRLRGLIGRSFERLGCDAMVFPSCSSIHTCFMTFPIDVIFLGPENTVLKTCPGCRPWRPAVWCAGSASVIELPAGALSHTGTEPGDRLDLNAETVSDGEPAKLSTPHAAGEQSAVFPAKENTTI